jgi:hypothetical protein
MTDYVESLKSEFRVIQLFHPHACSEHPNTFPGNDPSLNKNYAGDTYGNPRDGKITCCKHHFTWMMNEVFKMEELKNADGFFFMEEDYVVAPTIYETIENGLDYIQDKSTYFGLTLDPTDGFSFKAPPHRGWIEKRFVTGPMVLMRDMFQKIKENAKAYCEFDEYNWYVNVAVSVGFVFGMMLFDGCLHHLAVRSPSHRLFCHSPFLRKSPGIGLSCTSWVKACSLILSSYPGAFKWRILVWRAVSTRIL